MSKSKLGRPPLGRRSMTPGERQAASIAARKERGLVEVRAWIDEALHERLKKAAEKSGESVSKIVAKKLAM